MMNRKSILALTCTQHQLSMSLNSQCPLQSHKGHHLLLQSLGSQDAEHHTHCLFPLNLCPSSAILLSLPSYFFNLELTQHSRFFFFLPLSPVTKSLYKKLYQLHSLFFIWMPTQDVNTPRTVLLPHCHSPKPASDSVHYVPYSQREWGLAMSYSPQFLKWLLTASDEHRVIDIPSSH